MNLQDIKLMFQDSILLRYNFNKNLNYFDNKQIILKFLEKYPYFHRYEALYLLKNKDNLENIHIFCKICGKKNNWSKSNGIYHIYCSNKCKSNDPYIKEKISIGNKKVAKHALQERRKTNKIRYGDENYHNAEQMRITRLNDIDSSGKNSFQRAVEKGHQTNLVRIGVENPFSSKDPKLNGRETIMKRYGYSSYSQTEAFKQYMRSKKDEINKHRIDTVNNKYGVDYYFQTNQFRKNFEDHMLSEFNTTSYQKSKDYQQKKHIIKKKEHDTKKKLGIYGKRSKAEIRCYELIRTKYFDSDHSYYDERYPFNCDIYIPSQDLFIECHFSQYHHYKPFDENCIGDLVELSRLKIEADSPYFDDNHHKDCIEIIKTWTGSDVLKLKTLEQNNLNYKIFYTEKDFNKWFESL